MNLTLISNPISGKKNHTDQLTVVLDILGSFGIYPEIRETRKRGDARRFAREAVQRRAEIVVAAGGDGTLNEVANGLAGSAVKLALIPLGTANVFALEAGIPPDPVAAATTILQGIAQSITLGHITYRETAGNRVQESYFLMMAGIGFDAGVLRVIKREHITRWGKGAYLGTALKLLFPYSSPSLTISIEGREKIRGYGAIAANGRYYGGRFRIAPEAAVTDSFLDLCILKRKGSLGVLRTASKVFLGLQPSGNDIHYAKTKKIEVDSDDTAYVQADGDFLGTLPVSITAREKALAVIMPEGTSGY